jgi:hypothetical protein
LQSVDLFETCYQPLKRFLQEERGLPESTSLAELTRKFRAADVPALGLEDATAARLVAELAILVSKVLAEVSGRVGE